jgi:FixJ family two-component response regulator
MRLKAAARHAGHVLRLAQSGGVADVNTKPQGVACVALIEDDRALLSALAFALETEGYAVRSFATAEDALSDGLGEVDCLVVDQVLPGKTGLELLRRLRADDRRTPAVMITSNPQEDLLRDAQRLEAVMVEKPLLSDDLLQTVAALVHRTAVAKAD